MTPSHAAPISNLLDQFGIEATPPFADEVRCLSCHNRIGLRRLLPISTLPWCERCQRERVRALCALEEDESVTRCEVCVNRMHVELAAAAGPSICDNCRAR